MYIYIYFRHTRIPTTYYTCTGIGQGQKWITFAYPLEARHSEDLQPALGANNSRSKMGRNQQEMRIQPRIMGQRMHLASGRWSVSAEVWDFAVLDCI